MKIRNTVILVAVFAVLLGVYVYTREKPALFVPTATPEPTPVTVLQFDSAKVTKFVVTDTTKNQTVSVTRQSDNTWHMDQPKDSATDGLKIDSTIAQITNLTATRVLTNTTNLADYGLDKPSILATMTLSDTTQIAIKIGKATIDQADYYALKNDDPQVYLIGSDVQAALADYLKDPPYPPTPTPTPLPSPTPTETPLPGTGTPEATATPTP